MFRDIDPQVLFIRDKDLHFDFNKFLEKIDYDNLNKQDAIDFVISTKSYPLLNWNRIEYDEDSVKNTLLDRGLSEKEVQNKLSEYKNFLKHIGEYDVRPITLEELLLEELDKERLLRQDDELKEENQGNDIPKLQDGAKIETKTGEEEDKELLALKNVGNVFNLFNNNQGFIVYDYNPRTAKDLKLTINLDNELGKISLQGENVADYLGSMLPKDAEYSPLPVELRNVPDATLTKDIQEALKQLDRGYSYINNLDGNYSLDSLGKDEDLYKKFGISENKALDKSVELLAELVNKVPTPTGIIPSYIKEEEEKITTNARNIDVLMAYASKDENIKSLIEKEEGDTLYKKGQAFLAKLGLNPYNPYTNRYGEGMPMVTTIGQVEKRRKEDGALTLQVQGARPDLEKGFWEYIGNRTVAGIASSLDVIKQFKENPFTTTASMLSLGFYNPKRDRPYYDEFLSKASTDFSRDLSKGFSAIYKDSSGDFSLSKLLGGVTEILGQQLVSIPVVGLAGKAINIGSKGLKLLTNPVLNNSIIKGITNNSFAKGVGSVVKGVYGTNSYAVSSGLLFGQMSYMQGYNEAMTNGHSDEDAHTLGTMYSLVTMGTMRLIGGDISEKLLSGNKVLKKEYDNIMRSMADEYLSGMQKVKTEAEKELLKTNIISKYTKGLVNTLQKAPQAIGEGIQESSEELGFKLSNKFYNMFIKDEGKKELDDDINFDELASTFVLSTLSTGALGVPNTVRNRFFNNTQRALNKTTFDDFSEMAASYIALGKKDELLQSLQGSWKEGKLASTTTDVYGNVVKKEDKKMTANDFVYKSALAEIDAIEQKLVNEHIERQKNKEDGLFYGGKNKDVEKLIANFSGNEQLGEDIRKIRQGLVKGFLDEFSLAENYALDSIGSGKTLARPIVKDKEGNLWVKEIDRKDVGKAIDIDIDSDNRDYEKSGFVKYDASKHVFANEVVFSKGDLNDDMYNRVLYSNIERAKNNGKINNLNISDSGKSSFIEAIKKRKAEELSEKKEFLAKEAESIKNDFVEGRISREEFENGLQNLKDIVLKLDLSNVDSNVEGLVKNKLLRELERKKKEAETKVAETTAVAETAEEKEKREEEEKLLLEKEANNLIGEYKNVLNDKFENIDREVESDINSISFGKREVERDKFANRIADILEDYGFSYPKIDKTRESVLFVNGTLEGDDFIVKSKKSTYRYDVRDLGEEGNEINNHMFHYPDRNIKYNSLSNGGKLLAILQMRRNLNKFVLEEEMKNMKAKSAIIDMLMDLARHKDSSYIFKLLSERFSLDIDSGIDIVNIVNILLGIIQYAKENKSNISNFLSEYSRFISDEYNSIEQEYNDIVNKTQVQDIAISIKDILDKRKDGLIDVRLKSVLDTSIQNLNNIVLENNRVLENVNKEKNRIFEGNVKENLTENLKLLFETAKDNIDNDVIKQNIDVAISFLSNPELKIGDVIIEQDDLIIIDFPGGSFDISYRNLGDNNTISVFYQILQGEEIIDGQISNVDISKTTWYKLLQNYDEQKEKIRNEIQKVQSLSDELKNIDIQPNYFGKEDYILKLLTKNLLGNEYLEKYKNKPFRQFYTEIYNNLQNGQKLDVEEASKIIKEIDTIIQLSEFIDISQSILSQKDLATSIEKKYINILEDRADFFNKYPQEVKDVRAVISNSEDEYELIKELKVVKYLIQSTTDVRLLKIRNNYVMAVKNIAEKMISLDILPDGYNISNLNSPTDTLLEIQNNVIQKYSTEDSINTINQNQSIVLTPFLVLPINTFYNYLMGSIKDTNIVPTLEQIMVLYEKFAHILLQNRLKITETKDSSGNSIYSVVEIEEAEKILYEKLLEENNKAKQIPGTYLNTIHAVAGVGKTTMLEMFNKLLQNANFNVVYINHSNNNKVLADAETISPYTGANSLQYNEPNYQGLDTNKENTIYIVDEYTLASENWLNKPNFVLVGDRHQFYREQEIANSTNIFNIKSDLIEGNFSVNVPLRFENEVIANFLERVLAVLKLDNININNFFDGLNLKSHLNVNSDIVHQGIVFLNNQEFNASKEQYGQIVYHHKTSGNDQQAFTYYSFDEILNAVYPNQGQERQSVIIDIKALMEAINVINNLQSGVNKVYTKKIQDVDVDFTAEQIKSALYVALSRGKHSIIIVNSDFTGQEDYVKSVDSIIDNLKKNVKEVDKEGIVRFPSLEKNKMQEELSLEFGKLQSSNISVEKKERNGKRKVVTAVLSEPTTLDATDKKAKTAKPTTAKKAKTAKPTTATKNTITTKQGEKTEEELNENEIRDIEENLIKEIDSFIFSKVKAGTITRDKDNINYVTIDGKLRQIYVGDIALGDFDIHYRVYEDLKQLEEGEEKKADDDENNLLTAISDSLDRYFYGSTYEGVFEYVNEASTGLTFKLDNDAYNSFISSLEEGNNVSITLEPIKEGNTFKVFGTGRNEFYAINIKYEGKLIGLVRLSKNKNENNSIFDKFIDNGKIIDIQYEVSPDDRFFGRYVASTGNITTLKDYVQSSASYPYLSVNGYLYVPQFIDIETKLNYNREIKNKKYEKASNILKEAVENRKAVLVQMKARNIDQLSDENKGKVISAFKDIKQISIIDKQLNEYERQLLAKFFGAGRIGLSGNEVIKIITSDSLKNRLSMENTLENIFVKDILEKNKDSGFNKFLVDLLKETGEVEVDKRAKEIMSKTARSLAIKYVNILKKMKQDDIVSYENVYGAISTINKENHIVGNDLLSVLKSVSENTIFNSYANHLKYINLYISENNKRKIEDVKSNELIYEVIAGFSFDNVKAMNNTENQIIEEVSIFDTFETDKPTDIKINISIKESNLDNVCKTSKAGEKENVTETKTGTRTETAIETGKETKTATKTGTLKKEDVSF